MLMLKVPFSPVAAPPTANPMYHPQPRAAAPVAPPGLFGLSHLYHLFDVLRPWQALPPLLHNKSTTNHLYTALVHTAVLR
jgi:hypothetical protein